MSNLLEVEARIKRLPELQKQKQNSDRVRALKTQLDGAYNALTTCVNRQEWICSVFPDVKLKKTSEAVKGSRIQASRLLAKLKEDFDEITKPETSSKITRINERNTEAGREAEREWGKLLLESLQPYTSLVELVAKAKLPGYADIISTMSGLEKSATTLPDSADSAFSTRDSLELLREMLGSLSLDGAGGEFLRNAVNGTANARDLLNDQIQSFLDDKDLWGILKIKIGA